MKTRYNIGADFTGHTHGLEHYHSFRTISNPDKHRRNCQKCSDLEQVQRTQFYQRFLTRTTVRVFSIDLNLFDVGFVYKQHANARQYLNILK